MAINMTYHHLENVKHTECLAIFTCLFWEVVIIYISHFVDTNRVCLVAYQVAEANFILRFMDEDLSVCLDREIVNI